ncbi:MAG: DNA methyltransferase [Thermomicrobiales bacterium]
MATTILDAPNSTMNRLADADSAAHDWYRFVLSYPAHLVRHYLDRFGVDEGSTVLDPFCGTGTTLVECKKHGIGSIGIEAHPMTALASTVKVDWRPDPAELITHAERIAAATTECFALNGDDTHLLSLSAEAAKLLLANSISPRPLHKTLGLLDVLRAQDDARFTPHERLALAKALVYSISNLHFGPEVGVGTPKADASVVEPWLSNVRTMARDLAILQEAGLAAVPSQVINADSRDLIGVLEPASVDAVICSPPYPNEKNYTRTTRLETVLLGFAETKAELQAIKRGLVRSNTRTVYKGDDDDQYVSSVPEVERIAREIEARRVELGKTSGFERLYHRVTRLYFGGMAKHFADLRTILKPGAHLAYVVGDQASYLRVMIRTGQLLAEIAERLGYEVVNVDLFRTRLATATQDQLREEVVVLRWPGQA